MSSFRRFNQAKPTAPGTRTGSNGQKLTSSGVPSLDELYGGGIPLGRLLLLKQDRYSSYSNVLLKYYIAQGIMFGHESFVISLDSNPESILTELMGVVEGKSGSTVQEEEQQTRQLGQLRQGQMNIAWRYQNLPQLNSTLGKGNPSTFCHLFDLTKRMTPEHLSKSRITLVNREMVKLDPYDRVFELLEKKIQESTFQDSNVLRIAIHSIASPLWGTKKLYQFLHRLKVLVRNKNVVVMMTIPAHIYGDFNGHAPHPIIKRAEYAVDAVLEIESFVGSPLQRDEKVTGDYHGLIHPHHLFQVDSLIETTRLGNVERHSLGFKVRRKRFEIEPFILPPEEGEVKQRGCGSEQDPLAF